MNYQYFGIDNKIIIIMVGLPARGKSYTSNSLCRYLTWSGYKCKVFNSGKLRRSLYPECNKAEFFNPDNKNNNLRLEKISIQCFIKMIEWLKQNGQIGIFDATNSTIKRRQELIKLISQYKLDCSIIFIEIICNNSKLIHNNITMKKFSDDYKEMSNSEAIEDFKIRLKYYTSKYQEISNSENINYIKLIKESNSLILNNVYGIIEGQITSYLQNLKINKHPIYITRHGESIYNTENRLGGDSDLTKVGLSYSDKLFKYINNLHPNELTVFTSCLKRSKMTGRHFSQTIESNLLNEINAGICENMTYKEVEEKYSELFRSRKDNKLHFRYPGGESYMDILEKLKLFILNLECVNQPILIISHRAVIRVLLAYFLNYPLTEMPHKEISLNRVIKLIPTSDNYKLQYVNL